MLRWLFGKKKNTQGRVLWTVEASEAVKSMIQILNNGITEDLDTLICQGQALSDVKEWDSLVASDFRKEWLQTQATLEEAREVVETLRSWSEQILFHNLEQC